MNYKCVFLSSVLPLNKNQQQTNKINKKIVCIDSYTYKKKEFIQRTISIIRYELKSILLFYSLLSSTSLDEVYKMANMNVRHGPSKL